MMDFLFNLIIGPLKFVFEFLYSIFFKLTGSYGFSIVLLSLSMNILVLPLYRRADAIQDEENRIEKKLEKGVAHIKKTFKGDERYMMLQTYYRQNNYKPSYVLRGLLPLLLEIPFFMAAYSFLSNLECLTGASFGPITNLIEQDKLLFGINVLPVLMTVINIVSSSIYSKDAPLKSRIQLYLMATVFLVLLYDSPSGLVLYWTLNNIFSLVKNIITKTKNPKKLMDVVLAVVGVGAIVSSFTLFRNISTIRKIFVIMAGILLCFPLLNNYWKIKLPVLDSKGKKTDLLFFGSCLFLAILTGLYIPLTVIKSSPAEFIDFYTTVSPIEYVYSAFTLALGLFVIWVGIYYLLANKSTRTLFAYVLFSLSLVAILNYLVFDTDFGNMSSNLIFDKMFEISLKGKLINLAADGIIFVIVYAVWNKILNVTQFAICAFAGALAVTSVVTINEINPVIEENMEVISNSKEAGIAETTLSKNGKNVVLIMLDRGISNFIPYIFEEKPELYEIYSGFTYYPNTLAYGASTNISTPSLFGGYEYTPEKIQERDDESLKDKQNEALKVLPVLFSNEGYKTTVCNPSYANYQWIPDLSIFDEYENIKAYNTNNGEFLHVDTQELDNLERNLFCYGLFRISPSIMKRIVYDNGNYRSMQAMATTYHGDTDEETLTVLSNIYEEFADNYAVLDKLEGITRITESDENTYFSIVNDLTHEPMILQEPDYMPAYNVNNESYDEMYKVRTSWNGEELEMESDYQKSHYQTNMGALLLIGDWIEYLKENDVYDNTRIIICSDHSRDLDLFDTGMESEKSGMDVSCFNAVLMVKDFDSTEFTVNEEFMTLADIPTLLTDDLIDNPVNPMTGNAIESSEKQGEQYVLDSPWDIEESSENQFAVNTWYSIHDNIFDVSNWEDITNEK